MAVVEVLDLLGNNDDNNNLLLCVSNNRLDSHEHCQTAIEKLSGTVLPGYHYIHVYN